MLTARNRRSSVASRIHISFLLAAALPLLVLAGVSYTLVKTELQHGALRDAHRLARETGMAVFDRLKFVNDQLTLLARQSPMSGDGVPQLGGLDLEERVFALFRVSATDGIVGNPHLSAVERRELLHAVATADRDKPLLLALGRPAERRLFMFVWTDVADRRYRLFGAELSLQHLWDTTEIAARPERMCMLDAAGSPVFCNHGAYTQWLNNSSSLVKQRQRPRAIDHDSGEAVLTAAWSLFLKPHYQMERWTVLAGIPLPLALASVHTFDQVFLGVALIAILVAFVLGSRLIRSNLEPLSTLSSATNELARGNFSHRVDLHSGDEFQRLGHAFDSMAAKIGGQFRELETLGRLDRDLQTAKTVSEALGAAGTALAAQIGQGRFALMCQEAWEGANLRWYLPFTADLVSERKMMSVSALHFDARTDQTANILADYSSLKPLGADDHSPLQLHPVINGEYVQAVIALRDSAIDQTKVVRRVADVLAIALDNLVLERRLLHQANHDWLSGLPNRYKLHEEFNQWSKRVRDEGGSIGMLMLDLDRFKQINDAQGHHLADQLLADVARRLGEELSSGFALSRLAGDEFVVMFRAMDYHSAVVTAIELAERLTACLDQPFTCGLRELRLSASMGAAVYPHHADGFDAMLQCLDAALNSAKASRRGSVLFFSQGMRDALAGRMDLEQALKGALGNRELVLYYQPVVDAQTGRIVSVESLMRWQRPGVGLVMPDGFIDLAEQSGLIVEMGDWAIGQACRQMRAWQNAHYGIESVAVNVSGVQLQSDGFVARVQQTLESAGLAPDALTLEVTETALIGQFEYVVEQLKYLRELGVRILVDDFGTGYASLKYLKMLPIDGLKIDRLFVKDLPDSPPDESIVAAVVSLARAAGFKLVAEGIDTEAQADYLRAAGVPYLQGFLFDKGLPATEITGRLHEEHRAFDLEASAG